MQYQIIRHAAPHPMGALSRLPADVLWMVMQQLNQSDRLALTRCCKALAEAFRHPQVIKSCRCLSQTGCGYLWSYLATQVHHTSAHAHVEK